MMFKQKTKQRSKTHFSQIKTILSFLICLLSGLFCLFPQSIYAAGDGVSAHGSLHVEGSQLKDAWGKPVILKGFSTHGLAWFPDYINASTFADMKAFGANAVRLAMYTAEYNGYCTGGDQNWLKSLVKNGVQAASDNDMYVIVDWHVLSDQNPNVYKDQAKSFFDEMSKAFKNKNNVLYEICNEPNGWAHWSEITKYANEVIPVIRKNDPDAVILVGTPTWSQELNQAAAAPLAYKNLMYTLHFYAGTHTDSLRNTLRSAHQANLPVFVSEFGITDASGQGNINEQQANLWMQLLEEYGISYMNWSFCNKNEGCSAIRSDVAKTSGITFNDLSQSGRWFCTYLKNHQTSASGGWKKSHGKWWYENPDGSWPKNAWKQIDGKWYHFDASGYMQTGWIMDKGFWYYLNVNGSMAAETFIGTDYVNASGQYVPGKTYGWAKDNQKWWYRNPDGSYPKSTWKTIGGIRYYFNAAGYMHTGWLEEGGYTYYLNPDGSMAINTVVDGRWIDENGHLQ